MANIKKEIAKGTQYGNQYQFWDTATDTTVSGQSITAGDIFLIEESIHRPAKNVKIKTTSSGSMSFRVNPISTLYPRRPAQEMGYISETYSYLASGVQFYDDSKAPIIVSDSTEVLFEHQFSCSTLEIVTMSGDFQLLVD